MREGGKKTFKEKKTLNVFLEKGDDIIKNIAAKMFFISWNKLDFFRNVFLSHEINFFLSEIGNNPMRALGRKKDMFCLV